MTLEKNVLLTPHPSIFSNIEKSRKGREKFSVASPASEKSQNFLGASSSDLLKKSKKELHKYENAEK